jgi:hypothetical protein
VDKFDWLGCLLMQRIFSRRKRKKKENTRGEVIIIKGRASSHLKLVWQFCMDIKWILKHKRQCNLRRSSSALRFKKYLMNDSIVFAVILLKLTNVITVNNLTNHLGHWSRIRINRFPQLHAYDLNYVNLLMNYAPMLQILVTCLVPDVIATKGKKKHRPKVYYLVRINAL